MDNQGDYNGKARREKQWKREKQETNHGYCKNCGKIIEKQKKSKKGREG